MLQIIVIENYGTAIVKETIETFKQVNIKPPTYQQNITNNKY